MMGNNQKGVFGGEVKLNRMGKFPSVCMTNCSELFHVRSTLEWRNPYSLFGIQCEHMDDMKNFRYRIWVEM